MKKALIVWGGWPGHEPEACARIVERMLAEDGYAVTVADSRKAFADPALQLFDLIVPIVAQSTITREPLENLCAAVEAGVGIAGYHGGMVWAAR